MQYNTGDLFPHVLVEVQNLLVLLFFLMKNQAFIKKKERIQKGMQNKKAQQKESKTELSKKKKILQSKMIRHGGNYKMSRKPMPKHKKTTQTKAN